MLDTPSQRVEDVRLQSFSVTYEYPVVFTRDAFALGNRSLVDVLSRREPDKRHRCLIFVDQGVLTSPSRPRRRRSRTTPRRTRASIELVGALVPVAGGEVCKNDPMTIPRLLELLSQHAIDRHSFAIAIGGGAVLDAVGYASAIFHRGVRHIRFPTTVLAQDDSGVGVKNAVNPFGLKNLDRHLCAALGDHQRQRLHRHVAAAREASRHGRSREGCLIRDGKLLQLARSPRGRACALFHASSRPSHQGQAPSSICAKSGSAAIRSKRARRGRSILVIGRRTSSSNLTRNEVNHGEAVAIGVALDTRYSVLSGRLAAGEDERVRRSSGAAWFHACGMTSFGSATREAGRWC